MTDGAIRDDELDELERAVGRALERGEASDLALLGEGEISLVLRAGAHGQWACKRLPPFRSPSAAVSYAATINRYVDVLRARGIEVVETEARTIAGARGLTVLYCVQPVLPADALAANIARNEPARAPAILADLIDTICSVVDATVGLDAQLSNWAVLDGTLTYLDVTTPLLRRSDGSTELDIGVFLTSMPWLLRAPVRRFVVPDIVARYHDPRTVTLDVASNLIKEGFDDFVPVVADEAASHLDHAFTVDEVRRDRRSDARTWAALQAIRRADRAWQRHIRRRPYPFLLPTRTSH